MRFEMLVGALDVVYTKLVPVRLCGYSVVMIC